MQLYAVYQSWRANSLQMKSNVTTFHLNQKWKFIVSLSLCIVSASEWMNKRENERMVERPYRIKCFLAIFPCQIHLQFQMRDISHATKPITHHLRQSLCSKWFIYLWHSKWTNSKSKLISSFSLQSKAHIQLFACSLVRPTKHRIVNETNFRVNHFNPFCYNRICLSFSAFHHRNRWMENSCCYGVEWVDQSY